MTQAIVRPSTDRYHGYTDTDGGEALREIRVTETSRPLAVKALHLLSDVAGADAGAFAVFPGSPMRPFPTCLDPPRIPNTLAEVTNVIDRCTPQQRRLLGDPGYEFRPGSYPYVPEDQKVILGPD